MQVQELLAEATWVPGRAQGLRELTGPLLECDILGWGRGTLKEVSEIQGRGAPAEVSGLYLVLPTKEGPFPLNPSGPPHSPAPTHCCSRRKRRRCCGMRGEEETDERACRCYTPAEVPALVTSGAEGLGAGGAGHPGIQALLPLPLRRGCAVSSPRAAAQSAPRDPSTLTACSAIAWKPRATR